MDLEPKAGASLPSLPQPAKRAVYATAKNTASVRSGGEMGGYLKSPNYYTEEQMRAYAQAAVACVSHQEAVATVARVMPIQEEATVKIAIGPDGAWPFDIGDKLYAHPAKCPAVPEADVAVRVASHIARAIEFIEKAYPGASTLDAAIILRSMRRWRDLLSANPTCAGTVAKRKAALDQLAKTGEEIGGYDGAPTEGTP